MIKRIIRFSAENKYLVIVGTLVVLGLSVWTMRNIPLDALPDLSDTQVIVYSRWDRSPDILEDQVTYPIVSGLLGAPRVKAVRGFSDFGYSYVYVVFEDGTDIYWARSRTLEYLSKILQARSPDADRPHPVDYGSIPLGHSLIRRLIAYIPADLLASLELGCGLRIEVTVRRGYPLTIAPASGRDAVAFRYFGNGLA
jgi:Cu/Ag efflux pump CusA